MPEADSFNKIAPYYDELMAPVPYHEWVEYTKLLLAMLESTPRTMLDVCCGTGIMCERLLKEEYVMSGFDLSAAMIAKAREKALAEGLDVTYWVDDARNFKAPTQYDSAICLFDSLNNITEPAGLQSALKSVARCLKPGGAFIFDLNTEFAFTTRMFNQRNLAKKAKVRYDWKGDYDPETRLITVDMTFWIGDEEFKEIHVQRAYDMEEVMPMLEEAGFEVIRAFNSYTLDRPRRSSDRIHYACLLPS